MLRLIIILLYIMQLHNPKIKIIQPSFYNPDPIAVKWTFKWTFKFNHQ